MSNGKPAEEESYPAHTEYGQDELTIPKYPPPERLQGGKYPEPYFTSFEQYQEEWKKSVGPESDAWWAEKARENLYWHRDFKTVSSGTFENGDTQWL